MKPETTNLHRVEYLQSRVGHLKREQAAVLFYLCTFPDPHHRYHLCHGETLLSSLLRAAAVFVSNIHSPHRITTFSRLSRNSKNINWPKSRNILRRVIKFPPALFALTARQTRVTDFLSRSIEGGPAVTDTNTLASIETTVWKSHQPLHRMCTHLVSDVKCRLNRWIA